MYDATVGGYFDPSDVTVPVGTAVKFVNGGAQAHTATSGDPPLASGTFDSGDLTYGQSYTYTFNTPGTYSFFCQHHWTSGMTGSIKVI
jgi:plastocyanin